MSVAILFNVPNLIGYVRLLLAAVAFSLFQHPVWFSVFYILSVSLDGLDGYAARKLNQCTKFGAWFDVIIDLFTRGYLWCALFKWGYVIVFLEWMTFVSTHSRGENWKIPEENFPLLVKLVMSNNFKTPMGLYVVGSLHVLPIWMYGYEARLFTQILGLPLSIQYLGIAALTIGRTLCAAVELFYVKEYIMYLLHADDHHKESKTGCQK